MPLSIVVPVLNEAAVIAAALAPLQRLRGAGAELILADGGSCDGTLERARDSVDRVVSSAPGRAVQMNAGASIARGRYLLFLHADTLLPESFSGDIEHWLGNAVEWGFFPVCLSGRSPLLRIIETAMCWRSRVTAVATGDQSLFVRAGLFRQISGFPAIGLMEDVAISKTLRRIARPYIEADPVVTSSRRWERRGIVKTVLLMWLLRLGYFVGVSPRRLAKIYYPPAPADDL